MSSILKQFKNVFIKKKFNKYMVDKERIDDGPPVRYRLPCEQTNLDQETDEECKLRRFTLGECDPKYPKRTILLVGATGSGKSTLINGLVNYVMGVKFEDKVWFEIIADEKGRPQADSQTSDVSVYEVFGFEGTTIPFSLTIIDTPGYGDTRGSKYDDMITEKVKDLFCVPEGVDTIDVVGLVLKATENRLDERMAYIFNSVTSLFGKDMQKNIVVMMTHSDGRKATNALQALKEAKVNCATDNDNELLHYLFNNCQKEKIEKDKDAERIAKNAFEITEKSMPKFFKLLQDSEAQSVKTTREVLKERTQLTASIYNLKDRIDEIVKKQEAIEKVKQELEKYKEEIRKNDNFEIIVKETYKEMEVIRDEKAVSCLKCKETCHYPGCTWAISPSWCHVMSKGHCTVCTGKCSAQDHVKSDWKYVTKTRDVKKTMYEMKAKYEKKTKEETEEKTSVLEGMKMEKAELEASKNQYLDQIYNSIEKLEDLALNTDFRSIGVHLDFLIEKMEEMEERNDTEKVQKLQRMKEQIDKDKRRRSMTRYADYAAQD